MSYLLDTNIVSELRKKNPNPNVLDWYDGVSSPQLHISALVVGEIRRGIDSLSRRDAVKSLSLERWLDHLVRVYAERIVPIDVDIARVWGKLNAQRPLPVIDSLLAATALHNDWALVTRNTKDVEGTGVRLLNPFE